LFLLLQIFAVILSAAKNLERHDHPPPSGPFQPESPHCPSLFSPIPKQTTVISTEAAHSLIVSSAVKTTLINLAIT
jgi:hypothetical protein